MALPLPALIYGAGAVGALYFLLRPKPIVAPTAGTPAHEAPVFTSHVGPPPPATAPLAVQQQHASDAHEAALELPASLAQVALAAQEAGVSVPEFQAAAEAIQSAPETLTAMGISPKEIGDLVTRTRSPFGF